MTYSCARMYPTLFSLLLLLSLLKAIWRNWWKAISNHWWCGIDGNLWMREKKKQKEDSMEFRSFKLVSFLNWQHRKEENFQCWICQHWKSLVTLKTLPPLPSCLHVVRGFSLMRFCLPKLYSRKLIINEFLPRGLTNSIFECLCVHIEQFWLLLMKRFMMMMIMMGVVWVSFNMTMYV